MKRLKLIQDALDSDQIHVYAPYKNLMLRVCTIHIDGLVDIFPDGITDVFKHREANSLWINTYGPDWAMEGTG